MKDAKGHGSNPRGSHSDGVNAVGQRPQLAPNVLDHIRGNPWGASITTAGAVPTSGYMVSLPGHTQIADQSDITGPNGPRVISDYAQQHSSALAQPGAHIGTWFDNSSKKVYMDVSHNISDRDTAIKAGVARNQKAIWDVKNGVEIPTGGTGE